MGREQGLAMVFWIDPCGSSALTKHNVGNAVMVPDMEPRKTLEHKNDRAIDVDVMHGSIRMKIQDTLRHVWTGYCRCMNRYQLLSQ
jgi:hypothetical protein